MVTGRGRQKIMHLLQGLTLATKKSGMQGRCNLQSLLLKLNSCKVHSLQLQHTLNTRPCQRTKRRSTGGGVAVGSILLLHAPCLCKYISAVTQVAWGMCKCIAMYHAICHPTSLFTFKLFLTTALCLQCERHLVKRF
jgi:hypothetical protein